LTLARTQSIDDPDRLTAGDLVNWSGAESWFQVNAIEGGLARNVGGQDDFIKDNLPFDQLIYEFGDDDNPDWVHVSYNRHGSRGQVLKAYKLNGQTKYFNYD
jgi:hypothetical protein